MAFCRSIKNFLEQMQIYIAGTHVVSPNMAYEDIIERFNRMLLRKKSVDVTFPEGISAIDAAKRLEEAGVCDADEFMGKHLTQRYLP